MVISVRVSLVLSSRPLTHLSVELFCSTVFLFIYVIGVSYLKGSRSERTRSFL